MTHYYCCDPQTVFPTIKSGLGALCWTALLIIVIFVATSFVQNRSFWFPFPNWSWAGHDGRGDNIRRAQYVTKAQKEELVIIGDGQ